MHWHNCSPGHRVPDKKFSALGTLPRSSLGNAAQIPRASRQTESLEYRRRLERNRRARAQTSWISSFINSLGEQNNLPAVVAYSWLVVSVNQKPGTDTPRQPSVTPVPVPEFA